MSRVKAKFLAPNPVDGQVLTADSTQAEGHKWAAAGGGGSTTNCVYLTSSTAYPSMSFTLAANSKYIIQATLIADATGNNYGYSFNIPSGATMYGCGVCIVTNYSNQTFTYYQNDLTTFPPFCSVNINRNLFTAQIYVITGSSAGNFTLNFNWSAGSMTSGSIMTLTKI